MHKLDYVPCSSLACYLVELAALYAKRIIFGYKCDLEQLRQDISDTKRFIELECYIEQCNLSGDIVDQIRRFKNRLNSTYSNFCRNCE